MLTFSTEMIRSIPKIGYFYQNKGNYNKYRYPIRCLILMSTFYCRNSNDMYAQLMLDENSRKYVTINTHLGLFRYRRLPYGISAAPAIFQATMDKILAGIKVGCFLDDIIVTGSNGAEHLHNLEALFKRLDAYGISLKRKIKV